MEMALYDPREFPEAKVGADFTVAEFLAWARTKPADQAYCYTSNGECAVAQFLRDTGRAAEPRVCPWQWRDGLDGAWHRFSDEIEDAVDGQAANTFGALVGRLAKARASNPTPPSDGDGK